MKNWGYRLIDDEYPHEVYFVKYTRELVDNRNCLLQNYVINDVRENRIRVHAWLDEFVGNEFDDYDCGSSNEFSEWGFRFATLETATMFKFFIIGILEENGLC